MGLLGILVGLLLLVWLVFWLRIYRTPEQHPRVSPGELAYIRSDPPEATVKIPWARLLPHRQIFVHNIRLAALHLRTRHQKHRQQKDWNLDVRLEIAPQVDRHIVPVVARDDRDQDRDHHPQQGPEELHRLLFLAGLLGELGRLCQFGGRSS